MDRISDSVQIRKNKDTILSIYGKIRIREGPYFGIFQAVPCWTFSVITYTHAKISFVSAKISRTRIYELFNCAKIKGANTNRAEIRGARNLTGLRYSQKTLVFFNNSLFLRPKVCNFIKKETATQVFSCEYCKIFKNTFFDKHLQTAARICLKIIFLQWKSWQSEAYSEPSRTSKKELFAKIHLWQYSAYTFIYKQQR